MRKKSNLGIAAIVTVLTALAAVPASAAPSARILVYAAHGKAFTDMTLFAGMGQANVRSCAVRLDPGSKVVIYPSVSLPGNPPSPAGDTYAYKWGMTSDPAQAVPVKSPVTYIRDPNVMLDAENLPAQIYLWAYRNGVMTDMESVAFVRVPCPGEADHIAIIEVRPDPERDDPRYVR